MIKLRLNGTTSYTVYELNLKSCLIVKLS